LLAAQPWRTGEHGEISAEACPFRDDWNDSFTSGKVPLCASPPPTFTEAPRPTGRVPSAVPLKTKELHLGLLPDDTPHPFR
jgi:hypothetical protein